MKLRPNIYEYFRQEKNISFRRKSEKFHDLC